MLRELSDYLEEETRRAAERVCDGENLRLLLFRQSEQ